MKIGRIISFILLSALTFSAFTACAPDAEKPDTGNIPDNTGKTIDTSAGTDAKTTAIPDNNPPAKAEWEKDGVLRILTIGNSFSDDTMEYVYQIAKSAGIDKIELGNLYIGGCTLDTHVANAKGDKAAYEYRTNTRGKWTTKTWRRRDHCQP